MSTDERNATPLAASGWPERLLGLFRIVPSNVAWWLGGMLGDAFGRLPMRDQRRCRVHLAKAFPEKSPAWVEATARKTFRHFGRMAFWTLATLHRDPRELRRGIIIEGAEHIRPLLRSAGRGQSAMMFTGHFGNWELFARVGSTFLPIAVIGRRLRSALANRLIQASRAGGGAQVVYQDSDVRTMLRVLRAGRNLATLPDQAIPRLAGPWVPWFGDLCLTPTGPAGLTMMAGGRAMSTYLYWQHGSGPVGGGRWVAHFGPLMQFPARASDGDRAAILHRITAWSVAYHEAIVRRAPEQWVWWHLRWRTRPPAGWVAPISHGMATESTYSAGRCPATPCQGPLAPGPGACPEAL